MQAPPRIVMGPKETRDLPEILQRVEELDPLTARGTPGQASYPQGNPRRERGTQIHGEAK